VLQHLKVETIPASGTPKLGWDILQDVWDVPRCTTWVGGEPRGLQPIALNFELDFLSGLFL
jgi:hypothetical protein